jgi:hypothetical protein
MVDITEQIRERDAAGWQRGLYDNVKRTFRAPFVNWIFRTATANVPEFLRYAWGQVKPVFQTRAFAEFTGRYRDAVLGPLEEADSLPSYRRTDIEVSPAEFRELRGQLATFDVVAPRLAALFELLDRGLYGDRSPTQSDERASTAPFPDHIDRDRGRSPTMTDPGDVPDAAADAASGLKSFHGLDTLPSVYRCLAQWPAYLDRAWRDLEPVFVDDPFSSAREAADETTASFVDGIAYRPRIAPEDLRSAGFSGDAVEDCRELFRPFADGPVKTVIPAIPAFAATLSVVGHRNPA